MRAMKVTAGTVLRELARMAILSAAVASSSCGAPTGPTPGTSRSVQSFAGPVQALVGGASPGFEGIWRGEYLLVECRATSPALCKDAPLRSAINLRLSQTNSVLDGTIEFLGRTSPFKGFVTSDFGIAGGAQSDIDVAVRLSRSNETLTGFVVKDTYANGQVVMSKRYDVVTPLRRD